MTVNVKKIKNGKAERYSFARCEEFAEMPGLLEIQKNSYKNFLENGIKTVLDEFFPLQDYSGKAKLYITEILPFAEPKYSIKECHLRLKIIIYDKKLKIIVNMLL